MQVIFLKKFSKDLDKLKNLNEKKAVIEVINDLKNCDNINEIANLKKLSGFEDAYRIRLGKYRIGLFISDNNVELARIVHRKDIYKLFP